MVKKSFVLFSLGFALCLSSFVSTSDTTDWYSMGLKGKVKKITERWLILEDTIFTQNFYFSKSGHLEKFEVLNSTQGNLTYFQEHDDEGYTKSCTIKNTSGTTLSVAEIHKETKGDTVVLKSKKVYNISSDQSEYENYYVNHLLVKQIIKNEAHSPIHYCLYEYDEHQREIKSRSQTKDSDVVRIPEYVKVDKKGNWTLKKQTSSQASVSQLTLSRKISYY